MDINLAKFSAIVICFAIAATSGPVHNKKDRGLLVLGLFFTVVADFFLVVLFLYEPGVLTFCAVQITYGIRFGGRRFLRKIPFLLIAPIFVYISLQNVLLAVATLYAQLFIQVYGNMLVALRNRYYYAPNTYLISAGMTLFMLCDISVAIFNLGQMGIITASPFTNLAESAIWLFYVPSQLCLALSAYKFSDRRWYIS